VTAEQIGRAVVHAGLPPLPPSAGEKFAEYLDLLLKWNARLNLTAIREPAEIVRRHFLESIQCARLVPDVNSLLDFGSGAGFPGVPISILRPEIQVTLGESQAKKAAFLRESIRTLELNARVFDGRIESMAPAQHFGAVTLRAVDKMEEATTAAAKRVSAGGWIILFGTSATESPFRRTVSGFNWKDLVPLRGMDDGFLLVGERIS
jgi:16S rRNA (guanine527-N7)-methyltransferase